MDIDGQRYDIRAGVASIGGYWAHDDQTGLVGFVTGMEQWSGGIRWVHGEERPKVTVACLANSIFLQTE